ncbi:4Fe-4S dicluster domain-containing protein [Azospirillum sp. ST 5-10]|uniref:4Fe-4S dicluster domain-containing protein n=1 Tax=unclassified Azospirillum TaxID=2630922 RepID=UPI003F4A2E4D
MLAHSQDAGVEGLSSSSFTPRLKVVKTATVSTPVMCHHCEDAPCVNACPSHAIGYRQNSVQVDQERCLGCKSCMMACPFGAMDVVTVTAVKQVAGIKMSLGVKAQAHKCDLCVGRDGGPACVETCPTKALYVMDRAAVTQTLALRRERAALEAAEIAV